MICYTQRNFMARVVKETAAGTLEFTEELIDPDGDGLTVDEVILYSINGNAVPSALQNPNWLSFQTLESTRPDGSTLMEVFVSLTASALSKGNDYTFRLKGSDPFDSTTRFITLRVATS